MVTKTKGDRPTTKEQTVIDQLTKWIDPSTIAEVLVEEMVDNGAVVTFEEAKSIYLAHLEELYSYFRSIIHNRQ